MLAEFALQDLEVLDLPLSSILNNYRKKFIKIERLRQSKTLDEGDIEKVV